MAFLVFTEVFEGSEKSLEKTVPVNRNFPGAVSGAVLSGYPCPSLHRLLRRKKQKTLDVF